jgi:hypothetical protein
MSFCFHVMFRSFLLETVCADSVVLISLTQRFLECSFYSFVIPILMKKIAFFSALVTSRRKLFAWRLV